MVARCGLPSKGCVSMRQATRTPTRTHTSASIIATIALLGPLGGNALADDLLGMYVGGSVGQSHLRANQLDFIGPYPPNPSPAPVSVSKSATGWKVFAGLRPISWSEPSSHTPTSVLRWPRRVRR